MSIRIGNLEFDRPFFMAPMEGITDIPFRKLVRKHGCGVTCTQMIHAQALLKGFDSPRVQETSAITEDEKPVGMQLCGPEPNIVAEAAKKAVDLGAAFVDLNMGCPAKNVVKVGSGAALLRNPTLAAKMVTAVRKEVSVPVTVKIRAGWNEEYRNALEVALLLEEAGASLLTVHARTRSQKFKGKADWNLITKIKQKLKIPVVGNGDVFFPHQVAEMLDLTQADGVMMARGALGNPWLFSERTPTASDIHLTLLEHLDNHLSFYGGTSKAMKTFRKHLVWYTKGLPNSAEFRVRLFKEDSHPMVVKMLETFFADINPSLTPAVGHAG